jgi:hypothetical protein
MQAAKPQDLHSLQSVFFFVTENELEFVILRAAPFAARRISTYTLVQKDPLRTSGEFRTICETSQ